MTARASDSMFYPLTMCTLQIVFMIIIIIIIILGPVFDGTIFGRKPLYSGDAPYKLLLTVIVAP